MTRFNPKEYWETRLTQDFSLQGVGRIKWGRHYNNWLYRVRRKVFLNLMRSCQIDFTKANILDIGSGTGFYIDRWKELGTKKIAGADLTAVAVTQLRHKYPQDTFYQVDISDDLGELRDQQFDVISCYDVMFHIVDDQGYQKALENVYSLLKPGGVFVFSDLFLHQETKRYQHVVHRSLDQVEQILRQVGFQIVKRQPMFMLMNEPVDSKNPILKRSWRILEKIIPKSDLIGLVVGGVLYPIELLLVSLLKESPATEIMLCQKR